VDELRLLDELRLVDTELGTETPLDWVVLFTVLLETDDMQAGFGR
jgi:hypothetical protein